MGGVGSCAHADEVYRIVGVQVPRVAHEAPQYTEKLRRLGTRCGGHRRCRLSGSAGRSSGGSVDSWPVMPQSLVVGRKGGNDKPTCRPWFLCPRPAPPTAVASTRMQSLTSHGCAILPRMTGIPPAGQRRRAVGRNHAVATKGEGCQCEGRRTGGDCRPEGNEDVVLHATDQWFFIRGASSLQETCVRSPRRPRKRQRAAGRENGGSARI